MTSDTIVSGDMFQLNRSGGGKVHILDDTVLLDAHAGSQRHLWIAGRRILFGMAWNGLVLRIISWPMLITLHAFLCRYIMLRSWI